MNGKALANSSINETLNENAFKIKETVVQNVSENLTKVLSPEHLSVMDPNWFYSAAAQSSAAIVGILGAFLTAKIIAQKQETNRLKSEVYDNEENIKRLKKGVKKKREWVLQINKEKEEKEKKALNIINEFFEGIGDEIDLKKFPSTNDFLAWVYMRKKEDFYSLDKDLLKKIFKQHSDKIKADRAKKNTDAARSLKDEMSKQAITSNYNFERLKSIISSTPDKLNSALSINKPFEEALKHARNALLYNVPSINKPFEEALKPFTPDKSSSAPLITPTNQSSSLINHHHDVRITDFEVEYLENLNEKKKKEIEILKKATHVKKTLTLLGCYSVIGVFAPLFMMTLNANIMHKSMPFFFLVIFIFWLALLVYFAREISELSRHKDQ